MRTLLGVGAHSEAARVEASAAEAQVDPPHLNLHRAVSGDTTLARGKLSLATDSSSATTEASPDVQGARSVRTEAGKSYGSSEFSDLRSESAPATVESKASNVDSPSTDVRPEREEEAGVYQTGALLFEAALAGDSSGQLE